MIINGKRFKTFGRSALPGSLKLTELPSKRFTLSITARAKVPQRDRLPGLLSLPAVGWIPDTDTHSDTHAHSDTCAHDDADTDADTGAHGHRGARELLRPHPSAIRVLVLRLQRRLARPGRHRPHLPRLRPSKTFNDRIGIADIPIAADGSFAATTTQDGVLAGAPAHFTYTFSGHFQGTQVVRRLPRGCHLRRRDRVHVHDQRDGMVSVAGRPGHAERRAPGRELLRPHYAAVRVLLLHLHRWRAPAGRDRPHRPRLRAEQEFQ